MKYVLLKDICSSQTSNIKQSSLEINSGEYPIYGASGLITYVDFYKQDKNYISVIKDGSGVGKVFINPAYSSIIGTMQYIIPSDNINIRYLYHLLKNMNLSKYSVGMAIPHIYFKDYSNEKIPVLLPKEQEHIAQILDIVEIQIQNLQKQLKKYDELIKSQFIEMFGNVFTQKAVHTLGDYISDKTDKVKKDYLHENIKYVDISSIDNTQNEITSYTTYKTQDRPSRAQQIVEDGDIVISTVRPNLNNVAMIKDDFENIVASTGFCVLKKNMKVNEYFIFTLVKDSRFADYLSKLTTGASYPAVSNKSVLNFKIDMPPIELQNKFADFVKHIDKLKYIDEFMEVA